jgi:hypothetical protein
VSFSQKTINRRGSLADNFPSLIKEWDFEKNSINPHKILKSSREKAYWICSSCGNKWKTRIDHRTISKSGCKPCNREKAYKKTYETKLKKSKTLYEDNKFLTKQWHPTKNGMLTPKNVSHSSSKKVYWICERGHVWPARISNRNILKHNCPKCYPMTSLIEVRFFCELKSILNTKVFWKYKIKKFEVDIFIPAKNLGIEIDGFPWHKNKEMKDAKKNKNLETLGINTIRLRDYRLKKINKKNIFIDTRNYEKFESIKVLISSDYFKHFLNKKEVNRVEKYLIGGVFVNEKEFKEIQINLPKPRAEKSFSKNFKNLLEEWNYKKNSVDPEFYSIGSGFVAHWICKNGHEWKTSISSRTSGHGCNKCLNKVAHSQHNFKLKEPDLVKYFHPTLNEKKPDEYTPRSTKKVFWLCPKGHVNKSNFKTFARKPLPKRGYRCTDCWQIELKNGLNKT